MPKHLIDISPSDICQPSSEEINKSTQLKDIDQPTSSLKLSLREQELKTADLTVLKTLRCIREAMDALLEDGTPDHSIRLKAVEQAREILGLTGVKNQGVSIPRIVIVVPTVSSPMSSSG